MRGDRIIAQRIAVDVDRADDFAPGFTGGDAAVCAATEMGAAPVVEDDRIRVAVIPEMADQFLLGCAAAEVFDGRVDEPDADVVFGAGPSVGGDFVLDGVVAVFMFDGIFVDALAHDPLFLGVNDDAGAPVKGGAGEHVAVGVDGEPVVIAVDEGDETAFADAHRPIGGGVGKDGVGVDAAVTAAERGADFDVAISSASGSAGCEHESAAGDALDGDLGTVAVIAGGIDGDDLRVLGRSLRRFFPGAAGAHGFNAVVEEGAEVAAGFVNGDFDDAIVEGPGGTVVSKCDGRTDALMRDLRNHLRCAGGLGNRAQDARRQQRGQGKTSHHRFSSFEGGLLRRIVLD